MAVVDAGLPVVQVLIMYRKEWELWVTLTACCSHSVTANSVTRIYTYYAQICHEYNIKDSFPSLSRTPLLVDGVSSDYIYANEDDMTKLLHEIHIAQKSGDRGKRSCDCAQTQDLTSIMGYQSHRRGHVQCGVMVVYVDPVGDTRTREPSLDTYVQTKGLLTAVPCFPSAKMMYVVFVNISIRADVHSTAASHAV